MTIVSTRIINDDGSYTDPRTWPVWPDVAKHRLSYYFREGDHAFVSWLGLWTSLARLDVDPVYWVQHVPAGHTPRSGASGRGD